MLDLVTEITYLSKFLPDLKTADQMLPAKPLKRSQEEWKMLVFN